MNKKQTLGEERVRTDFNITDDNTINIIKRKSAELIDEINKISFGIDRTKYVRAKAIKNDKGEYFTPEGHGRHSGKKIGSPEFEYERSYTKEEIEEIEYRMGRLKALAMTAIEEGAMWAVKAATI